MVKLIISDKDIKGLVESALNLNISKTKRVKEGFEFEMDVKDLRKVSETKIIPIPFPDVTPPIDNPPKPWKKNPPYPNDHPIWVDDGPPPDVRYKSSQDATLSGDLLYGKGFRKSGKTNGDLSE